jgi:predicted ATPase
MLLQELQIEGFRSLKSVTWKPGRLNVLIGPNGGGKSNVLRALDLLRIAAEGGLGDAIIEMGGMAPLVWDGQAKKIDLSVRYLSDATGQGELKYELALRRLGNTGGFEVGDERLTRISRIASETGVVFERQFHDEHTTLTQRLASHTLMPVHPAPTETLLSIAQAISDQAASLLQYRIQRWAIHNDMRVDQNAEVRRAIVTRSEKRVSPDGQNLIAVLHTLYTGDRNFEEFLDKALSAAFPDDYDKLIFPPAEHGRTEMRVRRKHRKGADSPADLSDGTLRFLLLVTILGSTDPAPLIAIDEPEVGLHPRMMSIIADVAANAAVKSQVIFTTHSPQFLDAFGEELLPVVTVVTSNGSESELKTIGGDELKSWVADYSLGKFAFSGEAEAVL